MSTLLCLGRHTVTGLLTTCGAQFRDWTASYRLFSHDRLPAPTLFAVARRAVVAALPPQAPVRAGLDDSRLRRSGLKTPGVGQAQVRAPRSVESAPALGVAADALLLLATQRAFADSRQTLLPRPKWIRPAPGQRISTQQALHQLRAEVWGRGLGLDNFSGFASTPPSATKLEKSSFPLASAVCYANA